MGRGRVLEDRKPACGVRGDLMTTREALLLILDQVDYTAGNCSITEMVGAVLPKEVIELCRKAIADEFDCYANAHPDEPIFVLLGRDRHEAGLVRLWALLRHREGEGEAKIAEALRCADA